MLLPPNVNPPTGREEGVLSRATERVGQTALAGLDLSRAFCTEEQTELKSRKSFCGEEKLRRTEKKTIVHTSFNLLLRTEKFFL